MTRRIVLSAFVFAWILLPAVPSVAEQPVSEKPLPPSVVVEEGPFGSAVVMDGVLAPLGAVEVKCDPKHYSGPFEFVEAVGAGPVEPGQTLAKFDREPIDRQLEAGALDLELARTRFEQSEIKRFSEIEKLRLALEDARRAHRIAKEKLERFERVERQLRVDEAVQGMAWTRDSLSNQQEELEQLEKMYKEDDLTEETEEIVLRRARRALERSKRSFEFRKLRHKWFLTETLPRDHEGLRLALRKREIKLDEATKSLELEKREVELEHKKAKRDLAEQDREYSELKADRELMVVRAPSSGGYALPGDFRGGKWSGLGEDGIRWRPGDRVSRGVVLYTVFEPTRLGVRATVDQTHLAAIRPGRPCRVSSSVAAGSTFPAEVELVADYAEGTKYDVRIALRSGHPWFRAGQKVKATVMGASAPVGLSIPTRCVVGKGTKAHVLLLGAAGVETRPVLLGEKIGDRIGIRKGLAAGQRVLLDPPKQGLDVGEEKNDEDEDEAEEESPEDERDAGRESRTEQGEEARGEDAAEKPAEASLVGTWRGRVKGPPPFPPEGIPGALLVTQGYGGQLEGVFEMAGTQVEVDTLEFDPETGIVELDASSETGNVRAEGRVEGDLLTGTWSTTDMGGLEGTFRFEREGDA